MSDFYYALLCKLLYEYNNEFDIYASKTKTVSAFNGSSDAGISARNW